MYQFQQVKTSVALIDKYKGQEPFHLFLKKYFSENRKHGSTDRKNISELCYSYFRLGKAFQQVITEERIIIGLFLCSNGPNKLLEVLRPEWNERSSIPVVDKLNLLEYGIGQHVFFPYCELLSEGINCNEYGKSFLLKPDVFIRVRPGFENIVKQKLEDAGIGFTQPYQMTYGFAPTSKLENILNIGKEVIVQDISSQKVGSYFFPLVKQEGVNEIKVWDCCAASGGKGIMAYDINPDIQLTVSDIRSSILENLNKRFEQAGIKNYNSFIADLTNEELDIKTLRTGSSKTKFDFIIADVPCTGSGTWSRNPEHLFYFNKQQIRNYTILQRKIIENAVRYLGAGGCLVYITCSVFKEENEDQVEFIQKTCKLKLQHSQVFKGYDKKADTMFGALFTAS